MGRGKRKKKGIRKGRKWIDGRGIKGEKNSEGIQVEM